MAVGEGTGEKLLRPTVSVINLDPVAAGEQVAAAIIRTLNRSRPKAINLGYTVVERESTGVFD